ncbi:caspase-1-A [Bombina bombina]|uniref:caspase-1-A n=1 Tax=Bombina bombina TaxID=8345 RepID=UPI00235B0862|nr:caspase-1-A [Bombina bombina]
MAELLQSKRTEIINSCTSPQIDDLLDDLRSENIFSKAEFECIREGYSKPKDKCRTLLNMVIKKGDKSSIFLLQRLGLAETAIPPVSNEKQKPEENTISVKTGVQEVNGLVLCTKEEYQRIQSTEGSKIYKLLPPDHRKRLALMICNTHFKKASKRNGAEVDQEKMSTLLEGLGYQVQSETNLTSDEMLEKLKEFAAREEHLDSDSTFIVIMSHGENNGICGVNSEREKNKEKEPDIVTDLLCLNKVFNALNNQNCRNLMDKPKVIIIQACRGHNPGTVLVSDSMTQSDDTLFENDATRQINKESDFICLYSCTPDTVSWRHPKTGSLFIQSLIKKMNETSHCKPLQEIFQEVQFSFKGECQMPTLERTTLVKKFYLFPGQ